MNTSHGLPGAVQRIQLVLRVGLADCVDEQRKNGSASNAKSLLIMVASCRIVTYIDLFVRPFGSLHRAQLIATSWICSKVFYRIEPDDTRCVNLHGVQNRTSRGDRHEDDHA